MYNNMPADNTFHYEGKRSVESFSRCEKIITLSENTFTD